jgi:hypothetical protein
MADTMIEWIHEVKGFILQYSAITVELTMTRRGSMR